ncbi:hypothetical protein AAC387_Pa02g3432 [Persea americana]
MRYGSSLCLDLEPSLAPKKFNELLRESVFIEDAKRLTKMTELMDALEEEKKKAEAFKRELPLTMILLNDAIEGMREMEIGLKKPVLKEFIAPVNTKTDEKINWMSSAQLWSDNSCNKNKAIDLKEKEKESEGYSFPGCKYSNGGGDFMPIKDLGFLSFSKDEKERVFPLPDLTLLSPGIKTPSGESDVDVDLNSKRDSGGLESSAASAQSNLQPKKQRRCWSPELHTRFVKALQELGGPQAATPKQIRELMRVDGLTNDEVKSHLQKYRLHNRRHTLPATSSSTASNHRIVVLGEMLPPSVHYEILKPIKSISSTPKSPLRLARTAQRFSLTFSEEDDGKPESCSRRGHLQGPSNEETGIMGIKT